MIVAGHSYRGHTEASRDPTDYYSAHRVAVAVCECGWTAELDHGYRLDGLAVPAAAVWRYCRDRHAAHLAGLSTAHLERIAVALERIARYGLTTRLDAP